LELAADCFTGAQQAASRRFAHGRSVQVGGAIRSGSKLIESLDMAQGALESVSDSL
jgi:hypothetical protein